jgi:hypothetical protein
MSITASTLLCSWANHRPSAIVRRPCGACTAETGTLPTCRCPFGGLATPMLQLQACKPSCDAGQHGLHEVLNGRRPDHRRTEVLQCSACLRVGVVDLHGFAVGSRQDVAGARGPAVDHVLARRHDEVHLQRRHAQAS